MPTLHTLEAQLLRHNPDDGSHQAVESLSAADGIMFRCPACFAANGGRVGTHSVICWFINRVPASLSPGPGRWQPAGTGLDDLTFIPTPSHPAVSVWLKSGCGWHGHVRNGTAE